jgi:hypothetical protein
MQGLNLSGGAGARAANDRYMQPQPQTPSDALFHIPRTVRSSPSQIGNKVAGAR